MSVLVLAAALSGGCGDKEEVASKVDEAKEKAAAVKQHFYDWTADTSHEAQCKMLDSMIGDDDGGVGAPGSAGAPRWGIPASPPATVRVRRSWSSLDNAEKKKVIDGFLALKRVTVDSGDPGSSRADYGSLCEAAGQPAYTRNLYDYYVEAHMNAFVSMGTSEEGMNQMSHMGPQFLPWHRYFLLRLEADLAEVTGDPDFALPYWDWQDCNADGDPSSCETIFEPEFLGSPGTCADDGRDIAGYLTDQGFRANLTSQGNNLYTISSVVCNQPRVVQRQVGCNELAPGPADTAAIAAMFDRAVYDAEPYDSCHTEEDVSFRQYLEGYDNDDTVMTCTAVGCAMHSSGHIYIGGDMYESSGTPNDPMFFLHHAQVDRLWAAWQQANLAKGDDTSAVDHGNPGYPEAYRGPLFIWADVEASEMFDPEALGYTYDALPSADGDAAGGGR
jgi:tyrosinase